MKNILFTKRVRRKRKSFWSFFWFIRYYQSEKITLKEKIYTMLYNMERTGLTTKGEIDWTEGIMDMYLQEYNEIAAQFKKDYLEFLVISSKVPTTNWTEGIIYCFQCETIMPVIFDNENNEFYCSNCGLKH